MKIVIINGSSRIGNTLECVKALELGAKEKHTVEIINAGEVNVSPCIGCDSCRTTGKCFRQDDSNKITDQIVNADLIVFASPIYWWGLTAQIKTIIDKCYCKGIKFKNKKVGVILCAGAPTDDEEYALLKRQFELIAEYQSWDMLFFKTYFATDKNEIKNNPDVINEMIELGKSL